jgi:RHS repeat-associated protein
MDHAGRIQNVRLRLNDDPALERVIVANTYYDNGELNNKSLGGLRNVAYDYFLNGSLRSINRSYITDGSTGSFGEELFYDYGFTSSLMTGEIAGIKWRGDGPARAYGYSYDGAGRLLRADFTQNDGGNWLQGNVNFSVSGPATNANQIKYDANGNIEALHQKGLKGAVSDDIDLLQYVYYDNSNRLKRVTDGKNDAASLLGDFKEKTTGQEIDYTFDGNGNLTKDENKNITGITYNEIDMPEHIVIPGKGNIQFKYSADGVKHQKIINDQSSGTPKQVKYDYINGLLYENGILKYISHAEGRIRVIQKPGVPVAYWFDYFIKDHLGDIRVVYTEQSDLTTYMAGMEPSAAAVENSLFSNVDNTRQQKPSGYPNSDSTNKFAARLNAKFPDKRIGPSLVLKVMAGDTVQLKVNAFHKSQAAEKWQSPAGPVVDMLTPLMQTFGGGASAGSSKGTNVDAATPFSQNFADNHYQKLKQKESRSPENPLRPKAYLNYVLFDEQFNMVEENSGVKQVESTPDIVQTLYKDKAKVTRNGYLYVYTSNESQQDVYFDDLIVIMNTGRLLEETHYYPFGLTMEGISSKAATPATYPENKYRFNGKELQNDEFGNGNGLEWYDYGARMFDPQIGRWNAIDGAANKYYNLSPYHFSNNNPVYFKDVDGNSFFPSQWNYPTFDVQGMIGKAAQRSIEYNNWVNNTEEGRAHRIVRHGVNAIMADVWKAIGPYRTSSDRGRNDDGEGMAGMANKLYGQMTNALISVVPVLGSTVRALQAAQHGDKKGAVVNAAFAAMEGLSLVGGLRTVASSGARVSGFSAETGALRTVGARYSGNIAGSKMYIPKTPLAQQKVAGIDIPLPNSDAGSYAHTVLGRKLGSDGIIYRQSATFTGGSWPLANKSIVPWSRVDWSTHGRPLIHPFPHQHIFNFNGKNWVSGNAVPFP